MNISRNILVPIAVAVLSSAATYFLVDSSHMNKLEELKAQIEELEEKEREAVTTQRISEQMENIAFQQKAVSDLQRERAVEQSRIADMERGKAEMERGLALAAQHRAIESAAEAKRQAKIAEAQTVLATNNMIAAEEAKAHADTLFYLARATSLAQTSISMSANGNTDLSRLLSYAAWHFTSEYSGDKHQQDIFSSLLNSSEGRKNYDLNLKGNIRKVRLAISAKRTYVYGASDYGEIFVYGSKTNKKAFVGGNLRDLVALDTARVAVIDVTGNLKIINMAPGIPMQTISIEKEGSLPEGHWTKLLLTSDKTRLIAMSNSMIAWININTPSDVIMAEIDENATEIGMEGDRLHVFASNGCHYYSDEPGKLIAAHMTTIKERVTAYHYDAAHGMHILGMRNGNVNIVDGNGRICKELIGHNGEITHLATHEDLLATTSYDHTLRFWNIRNLNTIITPFELTFSKWPLTFDINPKSSMIWIGTEGGELTNFCVSVMRNAEATRTKLTREFTPEEWNYYIGNTVPYLEFR